MIENKLQKHIILPKRKKEKKPKDFHLNLTL